MQVRVESRAPHGRARLSLHRGALALVLAAIAALSACGGGGGGGSDDSEDAAPAAPTSKALCPESLDYATTFTGGTGSGELAKLQLDTTQKTWSVTILDSSVPRVQGTVAPTRSDTTGGKNVMTGSLVRETQLPTEPQNKCAFRLEGASLDPARPARVFVGFGVAGGAIPGARIEFAGFLGAGAVPETVFPFYQFVGFSEIENDLSKIAGNYNGLGYHVVPTKRFQVVTQDFKMALKPDGSFTVCDNVTGNCDGKKGEKFVADPSGTLRSANYKGEVQPPTIGDTKGHAYMIVGKLRGQLVPVMIRVGYTVDPTGPAGGNPAADDELGISVMAPANRIEAGSVDGQYIGVDSEFDYRAAALVGPDLAFLDPFLAHDASLAHAHKLDYAQNDPGVITSRLKQAAADAPPTGKFIHSGGVFGFVDLSDPAKPYFNAGAFVQ